jgi:hypothetical protein
VNILDKGKAKKPGGGTACLSLELRNDSTEGAMGKEDTEHNMS